MNAVMVDGWKVILRAVDATGRTVMRLQMFIREIPRFTIKRGPLRCFSSYKHHHYLSAATFLLLRTHAGHRLEAFTPQSAMECEAGEL